MLATTPVGYWSFDNSANLGQDTSGAGNNLVAGGSPGYFATGKFGGCLNLNGSSKLIPSGGVFPAGVPTGASAYTLSAWINPNSSASAWGIIGWGNWGSTNQVNALRMLSSTAVVNYWWGNDLNADAGADLTTGTPPSGWHHVLTTYDPSLTANQHKIYIDSELRAQRTAGGINAQASDFAIGVTNNSSEYFRGYLDDVAVWNLAMSPEQVAYLAGGGSPLSVPTPAILTAQWVADDLPQGTVAAWTDRLAGISTVLDASDPAAVYNQLRGHSVVQFDGDDALLVPTAANPLAGKNDFSVVTVFRTSTPGAAGLNWWDNSGIVDMNLAGDAADWGLVLDDQGRVGAGMGNPAGGSRTVYSSINALNDGAMHVAAYTRLGATFSLYIDGQLVASASNGGTATLANSSLALGRILSGGNFFTGDLAELRVYEGQLTTAQVAQVTQSLTTTYTVNATPQAPLARIDVYTGTEDSVLTVSVANGVLANDTSFDGKPLSAVLVVPPAHGALSLAADGSFLYTPDADYHGPDTFRYKASDGLDSNVVAVSLTVESVYDPPIARPDEYIGFQDHAVDIPVSKGVLGNDASEGGAMTATLVTPPPLGTLTFRADGSFLYAPPAGYTGTQVFAYRILDGTNSSEPAQVTLEIRKHDEQIVLNEIHYDPASDPLTEARIPAGFIELYNAGPDAVDLSGWRFTDGVSFTFPSNTILGANRYLVIAENPAKIQQLYGVTALGPWQGTLSNDGETIELRNAAGQVIERVEYGKGFPWPVGANGEGSSLELINPLADNDLGGSWRSSLAVGAGLPQPTPGRQNSVHADNVAPQLRQLTTSHQAPTTADSVTITVKATDPDGVAAVLLDYQVVLPGQYIPAYLPVPLAQLIANGDLLPTPNPAYSDPANWTTLVMRDDGTRGDAVAADGVYTAVIPAQAVNRTLVRYKIRAADFRGATVTAPYADDPSLNFAYYAYNGVPAYQSYSVETLSSLPVYSVITRQQDWDQALAWNASDEIPQFTEARFTYNWHGTLVYDGVVYDNISYRPRGANGRYLGGDTKRSMNFRFNKGHYFQARDSQGNPYPTQWRTLVTSKGFDNRLTLTYALNEQINYYLFNQLGVPAPNSHFFHFRMVDGIEEAPDAFHGDFWGLSLAQEPYDVRFLEAHDLAKGNLYKLVNQTNDAKEQQHYQAPNAVTNGQDHDNIENNLTGGSTKAFIDAHVNMDKWFVYHALAEALQHYDYWPDANKNAAYYFEPDYTAANNYYGKLWILPWDTDATWGPTWNGGHDVVYNALFASGYSGGDAGTHPEYWPAYYASIREIRDLLWQPDQIQPLLDHFAAQIAPFVEADRYRWMNAPADAGNYSGIGGAGKVSFAAYIQDMKNFAFVGGSWPGGNQGAGGRAAFLDTLQGADGEATQIPNTPTITYTGAANYPADGLAFRTSAFADPQGAGTFKAMEWRLATYTKRSDPDYNPDAPFKLEAVADWESGVLTTYNNTIAIPGGVVQPGVWYRARVRMQDASGRWSHWSAPLEFTAAVPTNAQSLRDWLRISEVNYNPLGLSQAEIAAGFTDKNDFEFIELINTSNSLTLDLTGAAFSTGIAFDFTQAAVKTLAPGQRALVVNDLPAFTQRYGTGLPVIGQFSGNLSNSGERIVLSDPAGQPVCDFTYGTGGAWPGRADGSGSSLQVIDPRGNPSDPANWRASTEILGTPGSDGITPIGGVVINEVLANSAAPQVDAVELYNAGTEPVDIGNWYLSDSNASLDALAKYRIAVGTVLGVSQYAAFDESDFRPGGGAGPNDFALSSLGDDVWLLAGDGTRPRYFVDHVDFGATLNGESLGRYPNGTGDLAPMRELTLSSVNSEPRLGPVVISEVMYDPPAPTAEELVIAPGLQASDLEYVEIFNPGEQPLDLGHWSLNNAVSFDVPEGVQLGPLGVMVFLPFDPNDPAEAAKAQAFALRYGVAIVGDSRFRGPYTGSLDNDGERLELRLADSPPPEQPTVYPQVIDDEVRYSHEPPWPMEAAGGGASLIRVAMSAWGSEAGSWQGMTPTPGAVVAAAAVVGRYVFYNGSSLDGADPAANAQDDGAIAEDKTPLLPGFGAKFENYTSYSRGINGIMFDLAGPHLTLQTSDFEFRVGNDDSPQSWEAGPPPQSITVRTAAGAQGSDRVTLVWADNAIQNQWLQITILANANTGLAAADVFYFGNAIGESGDRRDADPPDAVVDQDDEAAVRAHATTLPAGVANPYDFNRDRRVNATDLLMARANAALGDPLALIQLSAAAQAAEQAVLPSAAMPTEQTFQADPCEPREKPAVMHVSAAGRDVLPGEPARSKADRKGVGREAPARGDHDGSRPLAAAPARVWLSWLEAAEEPWRRKNAPKKADVAVDTFFARYWR